jgi:hypothetical protein
MFDPLPSNPHTQQLGKSRSHNQARERSDEVEAGMLLLVGVLESSQIMYG